MTTASSERAPHIPVFGRRKVLPRACIADSKQTVRAFLSEALEELGLVTCQCADLAELHDTLEIERPDLLVLGFSAGGMAARDMMRMLMAEGYEGKVLLVGSTELPAVMAVHDLGEHSGLAMLPVLATPYRSETLRERVASLLPQEAPPSPPVDVAEALHAGWLDLWYQPKIDSHTLAMNSAEALIRMRHPNWGLVPPAYFIPDDGDPNFRALSSFVIDRVINDWHTFVTERNIELSINLPFSFLENDDARQDMCERLPNHPAFEGLIIEVNGTELIRNLAFAKRVARQLRFHNVSMSVDDLGAEWPALLEIHDFPFVEVKVDRKFVTGCAEDRLKQTVCRRILELADSFGARTVAEGVETRADFQMARDLGFDLVQGFLFAKPMRPRTFAKAMLGRQAIMNV